MVSTQTILSVLRQNQAYLKERFGVESLVLFGSYATNRQRETSDVDLLYHITPGKTMPLMRLQNLERFISDLVQDTKVELVAKTHVEPIIASNIQKEGIVVF